MAVAKARELGLAVDRAAGKIVQVMTQKMASSDPHDICFVRGMAAALSVIEAELDPRSPNRAWMTYEAELNSGQPADLPKGEGIIHWLDTPFEAAQIAVELRKTGVAAVAWWFPVEGKWAVVHAKKGDYAKRADGY